MSIRLGQTLTRAISRLRSISLWLAVTTTILPAGCDMHRWAYIKISSTPPGSTAQSKGLRGAYRLRTTTAPAGQYLPCTPIDMKADVVVQQTHWSYILKKSGYNDEEIFVERSAVAPFCAVTQAEAKEKPFVVHGKMMRITSEKGLRTSVRITSQPPGVSVFDAGTKELIGKTPARMTFTFYAPYKLPRVLLFRLAGYKTIQRQVHVRSINLHVQMQRPDIKPRPAAPPPKKRRVSPPPRPPVKRRATPRPPVPATPRAPAAPRGPAKHHLNRSTSGH